MTVVDAFPAVDAILADHAQALGGDRAAYRNHVTRVLNFYLALSGRPVVPEAVLIAGAFHDLGIWTHRTFDYLAPSMDLASRHLSAIGRLALDEEVRALIYEHHKLGRYDQQFAGTVESFRRADLVDLSLGVIRSGLSREFVRSVRRALPNAGFHRRLVALSLRQFVRSPWRPLPMFHA